MKHLSQFFKLLQQRVLSGYGSGDDSICSLNLMRGTIEKCDLCAAMVALVEAR
jgi:hypothetical protein